MKNIFTLLILLISSNIVLGQGESCSNPIIFDCSVEGVESSGLTGTGSTTGCAESSAGTWFQIDLQADQTSINFQFNSFSCSGGGCKPNYALYNACGGAIVASGCAVNTGFSNTISGLTAGGTYYLLINGSKDAFTSATIQLNAPSGYSPPGSTFTNSISLTSGSTITNNLCQNDGSNAFSSNACGTSYDADKIFKMTIPSGNCSSVDITLSNYTGSGNVAMDIVNYCASDFAYYGIDEICGTGTITLSSLYNSTTAIDYYVIISSSTNDGSFDLSYLETTSSINGADGSTCSSPYNLTVGDGIGSAFSEALTTSNECAGVGSEDGTASTYCPTDVELVGTGSNIFTANTSCSASIENSQYFTFEVPTTGSYNIFIGNQDCVNGSGIQFFVTTSLNCSTSPATAGTVLGCSSTATLSNQELLNLSLTSGVTYYIVTDGYAGDVCTYDILITTLSNPPQLPVTLRSFLVEKKNNFNQIHWSTETETNSYRQILEKSYDLNFWEELSSVNSNNKPSEYSVLDDNPSALTYYRLHFVDFDGSSDFSKIISLKREDLNDKLIQSFFPNPAKDVLTINLREDAYLENEIKISIFNSSGSEVYKNIITDNKAYIPTENLDFGLYWLRITTGSKSEIIKFIKK